MCLVAHSSCSYHLDRMHMNKGTLLFILMLIVAHAHAVLEPTCNTICGPGKTTFVVSLQIHPDKDDCEYSWNNGTNFVLANNVAHDDKLVLSNTITSLVVLSCIDNVTYELNCANLGTRPIILCIANCTVKAQNLESPISSSHSHGGPFVVGAIIIIIIIVIAAVLWKLRQKYSKTQHHLVPA